jgi:alpha-tubulin suppressor-like RCC1 family protein
VVREPTPIAGLSGPAEAVSVGNGHACALVAGEAYCWGRNANGQLGDGGTTQANLPVKVRGLSDLIEISASYTHTCALAKSGATFCWGSNLSGELGSGNYLSSTVPVQLPGLVALHVGTGDKGSCALTKDGAVCWGENRHGRLGRGTRVRATTPVAPVDDRAAIELAVGSAHSCVRSIGGISCWGYGSYGATGSEIPSSATPLLVPGTTNIAGLAVGLFHSCGLQNGNAVCWGSNSYGETVGRGAGATPTAVDFGSATGTTTQLALGDIHTCVLHQDQVRCVGHGSEGQLGNDTFPFATGTPVTVLRSGAPLSGVERLFGGLYGTCAQLRTTREIVCWGYNNFGQLHDGSTTNRGSASPMLPFPNGALPTSIALGRSA